MTSARKGTCHSASTLPRGIVGPHDYVGASRKDTTRQAYSKASISAPVREAVIGKGPPRLAGPCRWGRSSSP